MMDTGTRYMDHGATEVDDSESGQPIEGHLYSSCATFPIRIVTELSSEERIVVEYGGDMFLLTKLSEEDLRPLFSSHGLTIPKDSGFYERHRGNDSLARVLQPPTQRPLSPPPPPPPPSPPPPPPPRPPPPPPRLIVSRPRHHSEDRGFEVQNHAASRRDGTADFEQDYYPHQRSERQPRSSRPVHDEYGHHHQRYPEDRLAHDLAQRQAFHVIKERRTGYVPTPPPPPPPPIPQPLLNVNVTNKVVLSTTFNNINNYEPRQPFPHLPLPPGPSYPHQYEPEGGIVEVPDSPKRLPRPQSPRRSKSRSSNQPVQPTGESARETSRQKQLQEHESEDGRRTGPPHSYSFKHHGSDLKDNWHTTTMPSAIYRDADKGPTRDARYQEIEFGPNMRLDGHKGKQTARNFDANAVEKRDFQQMTSNPMLGNGEPMPEAQRKKKPKISIKRWLTGNSDAASNLLGDKTHIANRRLPAPSPQPEPQGHGRGDVKLLAGHPASGSNLLVHKPQNTRNQQPARPHQLQAQHPVTGNMKLLTAQSGPIPNPPGAKRQNGTLDWFVTRKPRAESNPQGNKQQDASHHPTSLPQQYGRNDMKLITRKPVPGSNVLENKPGNVGNQRLIPPPQLLQPQQPASRNMNSFTRKPVPVSNLREKLPRDEKYQRQALLVHEKLRPEPHGSTNGKTKTNHVVDQKLVAMPAKNSNNKMNQKPGGIFSRTTTTSRAPKLGPRREGAVVYGERRAEPQPNGGEEKARRKEQEKRLKEQQKEQKRREKDLRKATEKREKEERKRKKEVASATVARKRPQAAAKPVAMGAFKVGKRTAVRKTKVANGKRRH